MDITITMSECKDTRQEKSQASLYMHGVLFAERSLEREVLSTSAYLGLRSGLEP